MGNGCDVLYRAIAEPIDLPAGRFLFDAPRAQ